MKKTKFLTIKKINLECQKFKIINCEFAVNCKICIKEYKCDTY